MVEDTKKVEVETAPPAPAAPAAPAAPPVQEHPSEVKKAVDPPPLPPPMPPVAEKPNDAKALSVVDKPVEVQKNSGGSTDRDLALEKLETEKRVSLIKAWEDNEKTKADNKACKKLSDIVSWENTMKTSVESKLKDNDERLEKKKAEYAEKMKNKIAMIHKEAEEKRAVVQAKKGEDLLKAEEMAAKYRATGHVPKKILGCFGS